MGTQEARSLHHLGAHQHRGGGELESGSHGFLRRERQHRKLQHGTVAGEEVKPRPTDLGASFHVDQPQAFAQFKVVFRLEIKRSGLAHVF